MNFFLCNRCDRIGCKVNQNIDLNYNNKLVLKTAKCPGHVPVGNTVPLALLATEHADSFHKAITSVNLKVYGLRGIIKHKGW